MAAELVAGVASLLVVLAAMSCAYLLFSAIAARASRWPALAAAHAHPGGVSAGTSVVTHKVIVSGVVYRHVLRARVLPAGLELRAWLPDRLAHRPLLLRWHAIRSARLDELMPTGAATADASVVGRWLASLLDRRIVEGLAAVPEIAVLVLEVAVAGEDCVEIRLVCDPAPFGPHLRIDPTGTQDVGERLRSRSQADAS